MHPRYRFSYEIDVKSLQSMVFAYFIYFPKAFQKIDF